MRDHDLWNIVDFLKLMGATGLSVEASLSSAPGRVRLGQLRPKRADILLWLEFIEMNADLKLMYE